MKKTRIDEIEERRREMRRLLKIVANRGQHLYEGKLVVKAGVHPETEEAILFLLERYTTKALGFIPIRHHLKLIQLDLEGVYWQSAWVDSLLQPIMREVIPKWELIPL